MNGDNKTPMPGSTMPTKIDDTSTLRSDVIMHRNQYVMENSDLYKSWSPMQRVKAQTWFYNKYVVPYNKEFNQNVQLYDYIKARAQKWSTGNSQEIAAHDPKQMTQKVAGGVAHKVIETVKGVVDAKDQAIQTYKQTRIDLPLGAAMLNASIAPHMGPIVFGREHIEIKKHDLLDQVYAADEYNLTNNYQRTTRDNILRGVGEAIGTTPAFLASEGMLTGTGVTAEAILNPKTAGPAIKFAARTLEHGANGYLGGVLSNSDSPISDAVGFMVFGNLMDGAGKFLGRVFNWGGGKTLMGLTDQAIQNFAKGGAATHSSPVIVGMVGSPSQKILAATVKALNEMTDGKFISMPRNMQQQVLEKLAKRSPEFANQAAIIDKSITAYQAAQDLIEHRAAEPKFDKILSFLEQQSKEPVTKTVAEATHHVEKNKDIVKNPDKLVQQIDDEAELTGRETAPYQKDIARAKAVKERLQFLEHRLEQMKDQPASEEKNRIRASIEALRGNIIKQRAPEETTSKVADLVSKTKPGAASAKSLEFEDNVSKLVDDRLTKMGVGKDKYQFEDRGHKLLFYLNLLVSDNSRLGATAKRNKELEAVVRVLQDRYPKTQMPELLKMSDAIWTKIENLTKAGLVKEGEATHVFRQTSLKPGESPFSHEVDLLQQATRNEERQQAELDEKLKKEFGKKNVAAGHTNFWEQAMKEIAPGKKYNDLSREEQQKISNRAVELSKKKE